MVVSLADTLKQNNGLETLQATGPVIQQSQVSSSLIQSNNPNQTTHVGISNTAGTNWTSQKIEKYTSYEFFCDQREVKFQRPLHVYMPEMD